MNTLSVIFIDGTPVEISVDMDLIRQIHINYQLNKLIAASDNPAETEAEIRASIEQHNAAVDEVQNDLIKYFIDNCENRHTLAELEEMCDD